MKELSAIRDGRVSILFNKMHFYGFTLSIDDTVTVYFSGTPGLSVWSLLWFLL